jgi:hypothetical protein
VARVKNQVVTRDAGQAEFHIVIKKKKKKKKGRGTDVICTLALMHFDRNRVNLLRIPKC